MNTGHDFDVIVVGGGMAGVACAGQLVLEGLRPLLVCETKEVGHNLRAVDLDGNRGYTHAPAYGAGWGGGYWYMLARQLNAPVTFEFYPSIQYSIRGMGEFIQLPTCVSAAALVEVVQKILPFPIDVPEVERVLFEALAIGYEDLCEMHDVGFREWMSNLDVKEEAALFLAFVVAAGAEIPVETVLEDMSVFGAIGIFRWMVCGETPPVAPIPDARDGIVVPIAKAAEAKGATIWRGCKVSEVIIENGRAEGVVMADGREARAKAVAIAAGTKRIPAILSDVPEEVAVATEYSNRFDPEDLTLYTLLDKPVCDLKAMAAVTEADLTGAAYLFPLHNLPSGDVEPGKQLLVAHASYPRKEWEAMGGLDGAVEVVNDLCEDLFPGFRDATCASRAESRKHHWMTHLLKGPKLPALSPSIDGLWYANDASVPNRGMGVEGAASTGVLRARAIAAHLSRP